MSTNPAMPDVLPESVTAEDFYAYMPMHQYIYTPTRDLWPAASVNARVRSPCDGKATEWLDRERPVEQMTWAPGMPQIINDRLVADGGWIERPGCRVFNQYRPPTVLVGDAPKARPWLEHVKRIYPEEADHIIKWLAHRVQRPSEKINHALVLGGRTGIGKDTILVPVIEAVGPWNSDDVTPAQLMGRFNGFLKSVLLRVSEARDQGDSGGAKIDRYAVYEHCKIITAAPPDVLRVDEKNMREYKIMNVCGVVFTTNHPDGLYLPPDDRRHFVAWSESTKEDFTEGYWQDMYGWYAAGGIGHVAAYLASLNISTFNPKAAPPRTLGFQRMVDAGRAPEDSELADVLDSLRNPDAVTLSMLRTYADDSFREWLTDRKNRKQIAHRLETVGYVTVPNEADKRDGQWKVDGKRQAVYAKRELPIRDRLAAAARLAKGERDRF